MIRLHSTALSANGRKPLALVSHLALPVEVRDVNVYAGEGRSPEYRALNPLGQVPTLVDGEFVLTESNAILVYLCEACETSRGDELWSRDAVGRADIARWLFWESAQWQPAIVPVLSAAVGHRLLPDVVAAPASDPDWDDPSLARQVAHLESHLAECRWLVGGALSIADLSVAGMTMYLRACDFPFERTPAFAAWFERIEALEAWQATAAGPWAPGV